MTTTAVFPDNGGPSETPGGPAAKTGLRLLWAAAILMVLVTSARLATVLRTDGQLDAASGVFSALAYDITRGELYRPLYGVNGYGGTRYFPLHPTIHAGLMKLGLSPLAAGYLIAVCAGIALVGGVFHLLRRLGVKAHVAAPCAVFALATVSGQWAISTIRGDLLPAAMNIWGLAFCARSLVDPEKKRRFRLFLSTLFFTLAFSGKMTTLFGAASVFACLVLAKRWKDAFKFAGCMTLGLGFFFAVAQWASHGWFFKTFQACADSDADLDTFFTAPVAMLLLTFRADAGAVLFWLLALGAMLYIPRRAWKELPALALLVTAAVTLVIFGSPGTSVNHLIDLHVIALVFFVVQFARDRIPAALGMTVLAAAALLSIAGSAQLLRDGDNANRRDRFAKTIRALHGIENPLFEIPTLPVIAGQRPYMTDPYMFSVIGTKHPEVAAEFLARLDRREFGAIVCIKDPAERMGREWFDLAFFGKGFIEHVLANYELLPRSRGSDFIYVPKKVLPVQANARD